METEEQDDGAFYGGVLPARAADIPYSEITPHCTGADGIGTSIFVCTFPPDDIAAHPTFAIPHAYVQGADGRLISRFRLDSEEPPEADGLRGLFGTEPPLGDAAERIARWLRQKPRRYCGEGDRTNWDAMRQSWRDMSEVDAQIARAIAAGTLITDRAEYEAMESMEASTDDESGDK